MLWEYAKPNAMLLAASMGLGAVIEKVVTESSKSVCRYPDAIAANIQMMTALTALEDVLPNPRMMAKLVNLCEGLCRLEFNHYLGAQYLAHDMVSQIKSELKTFRVIPWLTEDLIEIEAGVVDAVQVIQTNICVNF